MQDGGDGDRLRPFRGDEREPLLLQHTAVFAARNEDDRMTLQMESRANRSANTFTVLLSQPAGGYARTDYPSAGLRPSAVAIDDLDGDTIPDIVLTNEKVVSDSRLGNAPGHDSRRRRSPRPRRSRERIRGTPSITSESLLVISFA